jgi:hypothetical protein
MITVVNSLGSQLKTTFTKISTQLATAGNRHKVGAAATDGDKVAVRLISY